MRPDELCKFSDRTLKKVRDELHHRIHDFHLEYNKDMPRRKWTAIDRKMSKLIVELIDKQMRERRIIQNLKRLVGARELEMDYKLMTQTYANPMLVLILILTGSGVGVDTAYPRHGYAVSSLMDTAYWLSE
ncbi:hypothetical protein Tco_0702992 [Tanacetum coccineum]|uniref:Uncharacterized protein n=1 Tax=Tanacetum coccineum TaxID=301880 RepID=A0ABQ4XY42_9ASTR